MKNNHTEAVSNFKNEATSLAPAAIGLVVALLSISMIVFLAFWILVLKTISLSDYIQIFVLLVIASTLAYSMYVQREKERLDESQIFLEGSVALINKAYDILCDHKDEITSDRVSWVTAARLLTRASLLASKISLPSHKVIYQSEHDFQRHRFGNLLKIDGQPLPTEFFCGTGYVKGSVGDSACSTSTNNHCGWLPERVVSVIYRFKEFPDDYEDPLESSQIFNQRELEKLWLLKERGIYNYVVFRKHFKSIVGAVWFVNDGEKSIEVDANQINDKMESLSGQLPT